MLFKIEKLNVLGLITIQKVSMRITILSVVVTVNLPDMGRLFEFAFISILNIDNLNTLMNLHNYLPKSNRSKRKVSLSKKYNANLFQTV